MWKVEIISSSLVGMASDAAPVSILELTPWDLRILLFNTMLQRGILFHKPQSHQIDLNFINHLKNSLSRTLDLFPPLAGRLATAKNDDNTESYSVMCNNEGVEFVHAVAGDVSVSDVMDPKCVPEELVSSFFGLNGVTNYDTSKPLLGVQVTELADGIFIACTANHTIVDGISFWHFFNSWSEISRGFDTISKSPVFERWFPSNVSPPIRVPRLNKNKHRSFIPPPLVKRVFEFNKESLAKLKAKANAEAGTLKISSLQALSAHLWLSYTRCKRSVESGSNREAVLAMAIGARGRIPLAEGYFGNAVFCATTGVEEAELLEKGFAYAALKINDLVSQQTREAAIKDVEDWMKNPAMPVKGNFSIFITSSHRHDVYGNDFGWGEPVGVRCGKTLNFDGNMTVFPTAVGSGIEVHACWTPEVLQVMEDDDDFMEAVCVAR